MEFHSIAVTIANHNFFPLVSVAGHVETTGRHSLVDLSIGAADGKDGAHCHYINHRVYTCQLKQNPVLSTPPQFPASTLNLCPKLPKTKGSVPCVCMLDIGCISDVYKRYFKYFVFRAALCNQHFFCSVRKYMYV